jgi:hypothetical protein
VANVLSFIEFHQQGFRRSQKGSTDAIKDKLFMSFEAKANEIISTPLSKNEWVAA